MVEQLRPGGTMPSENSENKPVTIKDELDGEVSLEAALNESGLSLKAKSRTVSAFDRLFGALVGIPAEMSEGIRQRSKIRQQIKTDSLLLQAKELTAALNASPQLGFILEHVVIEQARKLENKSAIWQEAETLLLQATDRSTEANQKQTDSAGPASPEANAQDNDDLDPDWLNIFTAHSENATSERLRSMWAHILSGEIRKPGSFSPTTMRMIAELDIKIAETFQRIYKYSVNGSILRSENLSGNELGEYLFLEESGLIIGASGTLISNIFVSDQSLNRGFLAGEEYILIVYMHEGIHQLSFPQVRLTRVGEEIGTILIRDEFETLRRIGKSLTGAKKVEIGKVKIRSGQGVWWDLVEVPIPEATRG